jgi:hypothetical protein
MDDINFRDLLGRKHSLFRRRLRGYPIIVGAYDKALQALLK